MSASTKLSQTVPLTAAELLVLSDAAHRPEGVVVMPERLRGKAAEKVVHALTEKGLVRALACKSCLPTSESAGSTSWWCTRSIGSPAR